MPPPPPKASAPAPPKKSAPKPPGAKGSKAKNKSQSKKPNNSYQAKDDSTYELGKTAASAAGAAAKAAFLSFGSKVKKDVKSFTKKELENAGVDTNKPKKPAKPKEKSQPAAAPKQLKSYNMNMNMNWKKKSDTNNTNNSKPKSKSKSKVNTKAKSNEFGAPKKAPKISHNRSKSKGSKPPPPKKKNGTKSNGKKNGVSGRLAMFEEKDRKAGKSGGSNKGKGKSKAKPPPKKKDKESKSNGFFNKNKNKDKDGKQEKNLKPSMIKNKKKSPPLKPKSSPEQNKPKAAPPSELKSVNVDWKAQRAKMANVFKKKDDDKESKVKTKTKEIVGGFKKVKASMTAESVDPSKPPPKKMNLFKKTTSVDSNDGEEETKSTKKLTFSAPWKKSVSADIDDKKSSPSRGPLVPPPPPPDSQPKRMAKSKSYSPFKKGSSGVAPPDFDLANVNKKVAKPEDYNEIQFKAVDPMELRRQQKLKGAGRFGPRTATMKANKPTSAANLGSEQKSAGTASMIPPPVPSMGMTKKKAPPSLPSAPPPKPKAKKVLNRKGVLEVMPSNKEQGWVFSAGGMFSVSPNNIKKLKMNNIFEGAPVSFESMDKKAINIKLLTKVDANVAIECLTKKKNGKTKYDAKYFIHNTELQFDGNLSTNAFEIPEDCSTKAITTMSEKIVNAFMNTNGGILYLGIDKSWNIKGVTADNIDLPQIRQQITNMVGRFEPRLDNSDLKKLKFTTKAIITKEGNLMEDILVVIITVPGPFKDDKNDNIVFATENGDKFKKNLNYIMKVVM